MRIDRILVAASVVLVSTAIVGLSSGSTGASFVGMTTNPGQILNTQSVTPPASFTSATPATAGRIDLVWTATASPAGSHTLTYLVLRGPVGGPYGQVGTAAGLSYSDTPAADGTYEYVVQTKIAQGAGFFTSGNSATKSAKSDRTAPTAATAIAGAGGQQNGEIALTWTRGTDAGTGIASQTLRRSAAGNGACPAVSVANYPNVVAGVTAAAVSKTVTGLVSASRYCFYIVTTDAAGNATNSAASARITAN